MPKCHFTYVDGVKYFIPGCYSSMHEEDKRNCTCVDYEDFEKDRYNKVVKDLKNENKYLSDENKRLIRIIDKLTSNHQKSNPPK